MLTLTEKIFEVGEPKKHHLMGMSFLQVVICYPDSRGVGLENTV